MPLDYQTVSDMYKTLADAGVVTKPLASWSQDMNARTNSNLYDAGVHDNLIKQGSMGLDRLLDKTGAPQIGADFGRQVGNLVGAPDAGERVGHGLARSVINFAPMGIPYVGKAISGLLAGADTYTQTDSPAAGVVSGVTAGLLPGLTEAVEQATLKGLGGRLIQGGVAAGDAANPLSKVAQVSHYVPQTVANPGSTNLGLLLGSKLAGQGAAALGMGASQVAQQAVDPNQHVTNPFNADMALNLTWGQLPFAAIHALSGAPTNSEHVKGMESAIETTKQLLVNRAAKEALDNKPILDTLPKIPQNESVPGTVDETNKVLGEMFNQKRELAKTPTPENIALASMLDTQIDALLTKQEPVKNATLFTKQTSDTQQVPITGTLHYESKRGNYRIIRADDNPDNGDYAGKLLGHSVLKPRGDDPGTPQPVIGEDGKITYSLPVGYTTEVKDNYVNGKPPIETNNGQAQGELPDQLTPAANSAGMFNHVAALNDIQQQISTAKTPEDFESAVVAINGVRAMHDIAPLNAEYVKSFSKAIKAETVNDALMALAADTSHRIDSQNRSDLIDQRNAKLQSDIDAKHQLATEYFNSVLAGETDADIGHVTDIKKIWDDLNGQTYARAPQVIEKLPTWYKQWEEGTLMGGSNKKKVKLQTGPKDNFDALKTKIYAALGKGTDVEQGKSIVGVSENRKNPSNPNVGVEVGVKEKASAIQMSRDTAPVLAKIKDIISSTPLTERKAQVAFERWQTESKNNETGFDDESHLYGLYRELQQGKNSLVGRESKLTIDEASSLADAAYHDGIEVDPENLLDFPTRPHVKIWQQAEDAALAKYDAANSQQIPQEEQEPFEGSDEPRLIDQEEGEGSGHLMDFEEYAQRALENKGLPTNTIPDQVQRATELAQTQGAQSNVSSIIDDLTQTKLSRSPEVQATALRLADALQPTSEVNPEVVATMNELGFSATQQGVDEFIHQAMIGMVSNLDAIADIMPEEIMKYVYASARDMENVLDTVQGANSPDNQGLVNVPGELNPQAIVETQNAIGKVLQLEQEQQQAKNVVGNVANSLPPDAFFNKITDDPEKVLDATGDATTPESLGFWKYALGQMGQLAKSNPVLAEIISKGFQLGPNARMMKLSTLRAFGVSLKELGTTTKEGVKDFSNFLRISPLQKAADRWIAENQRVNPAAVVKLPVDHPAIAAILKGLSPADVKMVSEAVTKHGMSIQMHNAQTMQIVKQISDAVLAKIPMLDQKMKYTDALKLTTEFMYVLRQDRSTPQANDLVQAQIAQYAQRMTPEAFLEFLKASQNELQKQDLYQQHFDANPNWSTAQRLERYLVQGKKNGKAWQGQASSIKEADIIAKEKGLTEYSPVDQWKDRDDEPVQMGTVPPEVYARLEQLQNNKLDWMRKAGATPEELAQEQQSSAVNQFFRESAATGVQGLNAPVRTLSKGAEDLPYLWNHLAYVDKSSHYWTRQLYRAQTAGLLLDPEISANRELQSQIKQQTDNLLRADPRIVSQINKFTAVWMMSFQPATAIVHASASVLRHVAELTSLTGKPINSYIRTLGAHKTVADQAISGKTDWLNPEHTQLMKNASRAGEIESDWNHGEFDDQENAELNFKQALMKNKPQTVGQRAGTLAGVYSKVGMWMVKQSHKATEQGALLASFDYYRGQGLTFDQAQAKAFEFNHAVNPGGGKAQRSIGLYSGSDKFSRGVGALAGNMQVHILGVVGQLARYIQAGRGRQEGLTPAEQWNHSKAAIQMIATQVGLAGILGLPGVTGALALMDKVFPGLEANKRLREFMGKIFGQDAENGNPLTDIAMTGLPSMLGWDLSSRLSMGNVLPGVNEVNGFQPELMLGPPAALFTKFLGGARDLANGEPVGAQAFFPKIVNNAFNMVYNNGMEQDYKGRPLFQLTPGEKVGKLLGFKSKRTSDANAAAHMLAQSDFIQKQRDGQWQNQQAEDALKGNFGNVRAALRDKLQEDSNFDVKTAVGGIARATEEQTFPRDLRSEGTTEQSPDRRAVLNAFQINPQATSEMSRYNFRSQLKQRLGVMADSQNELITAQLMDSLRASNPFATRAELRRMASAKLSGQPNLGTF